MMLKGEQIFELEDNRSMLPLGLYQKPTLSLAVQREINQQTMGQ